MKILQTVAYRAFHRGGDGDKLSPSWARGESLPSELVRSTYEQSVVKY